jgi:predicted RNase H-like HicB family nuclease
MPSLKDYAVQVYWDDRARYFVAEVPEVPTCAADGATPAEALANLEEVFAVLKESYVEEELTLPEPAAGSAISTEQLSALADLLKVSRLAELAGIPGSSLATKLKRRTPLSPSEARRIDRALRTHGLTVRR